MTAAWERYLGWLELSAALRLGGDHAAADGALEEARAVRPWTGGSRVAGEPAWRLRPEGKG